MSLCPAQLSESCRNEVIRIIGYVTEKELDTLLKTEPSFSAGGFRSRKPELLRRRLEQVVLAGPEISRQVRAVLSSRSRSASLLRHLSTETIASTAAAWAALLGDSVFLVAALLDARATLRKKAENWLQRSPHFITIAPEKALAELAEMFGDITELLGADVTDRHPLTRESWDDQRERLNQRIKTLQEENRRLKGVDDKFRRSSSLLEQAQEENRHLAVKLKDCESDLRSARRELDETRVELQREISRREERLQAALDTRLAEEFHGWLAEAKAVEVESLNTSPSDDVSVLAKKALQLQAQTDRHSGNRALLFNRLEHLNGLHEQVRCSLRNAIRQHPELKLADQKLDDEINHLKSLLQCDHRTSPVEELLIAKIHAASDGLLPRLKSLPAELAELTLLDRAAQKNIEGEFRRRLDAIEALGVPPDPELTGRTDAAALLGQALAGNLPAILLLDGHNVLFGLQARYMPPRGRAVPDRQKRDNLISDVVRISRPNHSLRSVILFDGHTRSDADPSPNVRVIYSGGEGEHRADKVLIDQIRFFRGHSPDLAVLLVSNDNDLCKEARRLGAKDISVADFGAFL